MGSETFKFRFDNKDYEFVSPDGLAPESNLENDEKKIYFGHFVKKAPTGLLPGKEYCLKEILPYNPKRTKASVLREVYELLPLKGDHLRKILCSNDVASNYVKIIEGNQTWPNTDIIPKCYIIEERGESATSLSEHPEKFTVKERLDFVLQYAYGLMDLYRNTIHGQGIVCHRDPKIQNCILFPVGTDPMTDRTKYEVRLIDIATIRLEGDPEHCDPMENAGGRFPTARRMASPSNTTIEHVDVDCRFQFSEKTDVFAMGMMLASLFLKYNSETKFPDHPHFQKGNYINPLELWLHRQKAWPENGENLNNYNRKIRKLFIDADKIDNETDITSWLEKGIGELYSNPPLLWDSDVDDEIMGAIRWAFKRATRVYPDDRCKMSAFILALQSIIVAIDEKEKWKDGNKPTNHNVDVFIFDQNHLDKNRDLYLDAAAKVFNSCKKGTRNYQAICVSYSNTVILDRISHCIRTASPLICNTEVDLKSVLDQYPSVSESRELPNLLPYAIATACGKLRYDSKKFTGKVHFFTEKAPVEENIRAFPSRDDNGKPVSYNFGDFLNTFFPRVMEGSDTPEITVYYTAQPSDEPLYMEEIGINPEGDVSLENEDTEPTKGNVSPSPVTSIDPSPSDTPKGGVRRTPVFITSEGKRKFAVLPKD